LVEYLFSIVGPHYYDRFDIPFHSDMRSDILHRVSTQRPDTIGGSRVLERDEIDGVRFHLEGGSWGMIRFSGTEPLLRIYAEAGSLNDVRVVLEDLRSLVGI
jgi:phosphomannomutase